MSTNSTPYKFHKMRHKTLKISKLKLQFITTIFVAATLCSIDCAQLNNNYLPPVGANQAGGGPGLQVPKGPGNNALGGISPSFPGANPPQQPNRPAPPSQGGRPPSQPSSPSGPPIEILSYENVNNGDGSYKWR